MHKALPGYLGPQLPTRMPSSGCSALLDPLGRVSHPPTSLDLALPLFKSPPQFFLCWSNTCPSFQTQPPWTAVPSPSPMCYVDSSCWHPSMVLQPVSPLTRLWLFDSRNPFPGMLTSPVRILGLMLNPSAKRMLRLVLFSQTWNKFFERICFPVPNPDQFLGRL